MGLSLKDAATLQVRVKNAREGIAPTDSPLPRSLPKKRGEPERVEQVALAVWLDLRFPGLWCHVPNERSSARQAGRLAEEGVKPGVPDVLIFRRSPLGWTGCAIEMKAPSRRSETNPRAGASPEQLAWLDALASQGWAVQVCYSADEARRIICGIYGMKP